MNSNNNEQEKDRMNDQTNQEQAQEKQNAMAVAGKLIGAVQGNEAISLERPPQTSQEMRVVEVSEALVPAYQKASMLEITDEEVNALMAPFPDETVEIRPHDGLIFLSHIFISDRLNKVFKPGKWSLVRRREWFDEAAQVMYGEYVLVVRGCYVGESVGGHPYVKSNPKTNYSDVLESTAAEALRRIAGKRLSCGSQVWNPEYARQWVAKYAQQGPRRDNKGNLLWQKKANGTSLLSPQPAPTHTKPPPTPSKSQEGAIPAQQKPVVQERGIDGLKFSLGNKAEWAVGYLRNHTVEGSDANVALLPVETLDDLHETQVEWLSKNWKNFMDRLDQFIEENASSEPANESSLVDVDNMPPPRVEEAAQQGEQMPDEWFMDIVVPVPRKGQKRDVYLKSPDTIRSLYDVRHDDDEARRRLWGFVEHYEPKGWTKRDGTEMPASEADVKFRLALDAFADWFERNHPDEKL